MVWKLIVGILIAAAGLYFFFTGVSLPKLWADFQQISFQTLFLTACCSIFTIYFRALRWRIILPDVAHASKKNIVGITMVGFMINNIFPARLGEAARVLLLWRKNKYSPAMSIGSLVVERIMDALTFVGFLIIPIFMIPRLNSLHVVGYVGAAGIGVSLVVVILYLKFEAVSTRIGKWVVVKSKLPQRLQRLILTLCREITMTIGWLRSPLQVTKVIALSCCTMIWYIFMIMLLSEQSSTHIGILEAMFAQAFAAFGAAIPLAPGYVGTLHAAMLHGLSLLGMKGDEGRVLAILYHGVNYIAINIAGIIFIFKLQFSLKDFLTLQKKENKKNTVVAASIQQQEEETVYGQGC
ncbi:MAG: flippase-like domain-containing protein [Chitinivibrionales bacterium]|nr:flippase-like domain-containing protein [Chitinivibrionales bacterium]